MGNLSCGCDVVVERRESIHTGDECSVRVKCAAWLRLEFIGFSGDGICYGMANTRRLDSPCDATCIARAKSREPVRGCQLRHHGSVRICMWCGRKIALTGLSFPGMEDNSPSKRYFHYYRRHIRAKKINQRRIQQTAIRMRRSGTIIEAGFAKHQVAARCQRGGL